jgi:uncharacterized protein
VIVSTNLIDRFVFFPDRGDPGYAIPLAGVPGLDVTLLSADGVRLHGWWYSLSAGDPAVLLLHGNAGNISTRVPLAAAYLGRGVSIFLLDYRGYGRSEGAPTEEGLYLDAEAALDFLGERIGFDRIVVHGRSLGGAVAAQLVSRRAVAGAILEASFTDLLEMARSAYPFVPGALLRGLAGRFDTRSMIHDALVPVLVVHGTEDQVVPFTMGQAIHRAAPEPKAWLPVPGAGHNDVLAVGGSSYLDPLVEFIREVTELR